MGRLDGKVAVITGAAMVVDGGFTAGGSQLAAPVPMPTEYAGPSFEPRD